MQRGYLGVRQVMEYRIESWDKVDGIIDIIHLEPSHSDFEECAEIKRLLHFDLGLQLPLSLRKRERPDFELSETGGTRQVGIEHTWAAHEGWEQSERYLLDTKNPAFESMSRNWLEGEQASGKKLGRRLTAQQGSSPIWGAREQADAKAGEVNRAIKKKLKALSKDGFATYPENWLFISDRLPFLFLDLGCFRESLIVDELLSEPGYSRVLFITQVRDRERNVNMDVLFELSDKGLSLVDGHAQ